MIPAQMQPLRSAMRPVFRRLPAGETLLPLSDTFSTLDAAKWASSNTNGTVSIVSGTLDLTTTGAAGSNATVTSVNSYDLRVRAAYVKVVRPYVGTVDADGGRLVFRIQAAADGGDYVEWYITTNGWLLARTVENSGAPTHDTAISTDWDTSGYSWLKLSMSGSTVTWWTAPDNSGSPGAWTSRHTNATLPAGFGSSTKVVLMVDNWGTGHGAITQSARLDGFNTVAG